MKLQHTCEAIVVTCIDFRFQDLIENWLHTKFTPTQYDRVSLAGSVYDLYTVMKQIEISDKLHKIHTVILINHEDCGAYGENSTHERHTFDLQQAHEKVTALFPHLTVETYYLHLDGNFEQVN